MGNMKDFATGIVATAPSPANSGTSLTLQTGQGVRMPAVPFYATVHPSSSAPTLDNAEKIQVTDVTGDTLTIVRAQGDTTAKSIETGWVLSNTLFTADLVSDAEKSAITHSNRTVLDNTTASFTTADESKLDGLTQYTDEMAQDAIGGMVNSTLTYTDGTPELKVTNPVTPQATGFTISAGTTPKTLTVALDASVAGTNTGDQTLPTRDSLGLDTDDSPQFAGVNVGHASDTTITRVSAGLIAVEGKNLIDASTSQTATNKVVTNIGNDAPATPATGMLWWDTDDTSNPGGDLSTDHISEVTAGHGVSIDGVTLKDGDVTGTTARLQSKIITATRDAGAVSGNTAYTGVGFTPSAIKCYMTVDGGPYQCIAESDSSRTCAGIYTSAADVQYTTALLASYSNQSAWAQNATIASYDSDGFTLTWTKVGTPTAGTIKLSFVCYR